jgi:protein-disulfide isomerase
MHIRNLRRAIALLTIGLLASAAHAEAALGRAEIEKIVQEYITNNPQVIVDAVNALRQKQQQEAKDAQRDALKQNDAALRGDSRDPALGAAAADADVTIVEFFDYNCGYCKQTAPELFKLIEGDKKVRIIMKEFPILSPESITASRYALAVNKLDPAAYARYHRALMEFKGQKTETALVDLLKDVGVDVNTVKARLNDEDINKHLQDTQLLANKLSIAGTPAFIVGDQLLASAMNKDMLLQQIGAIRQQASVQGALDQKLKEAAKSP